MSPKFFSVVLLALSCSISPTLTTAEELVLGLAQNEAVQDVAADILTEIYKRAGLNPKIDLLPPARITQLVLNNKIDGEVARIGPYFEKNPSLFKVEPSYYYLTTTAFAKTDRGIVINAKEDLKKYKVGIIRGVHHAVIATEGVVNLEVTDSVEQLFKMLESDRIDIVVDVGINGRDIIKQLDLKDIGIVSEMAKRDFFNVLIQSKSHLAPRISSVIKAMKASGELSKLINIAEKKRLGTRSNASDAVK